MKNVAILITKLYGGGAERAAANLSLQLEKFYNIKLIVFDGRNQTYNFGGELIDLELPASKNVFKKVFNIVRRIIKLRKIKRKYNIDCTISFLDGPNLVNVLSRINDRVLVSIRSHLSKSRKDRLLLTKNLTKFVINSADKCVAVSKAVELDLIETFGIPRNKLTTIVNFCDINFIQNQINLSDPKDPFQFDGNYKYVVTIGRLTQQKGHWHLIRAFKKVHNRIPNTKLIILGDGELKEKLINLAKEYKLENNILFPGYVSNPHSIVSKCDVFVLPSLFEGLSNALLEAMACGLAIISTDCGSGSREVLAPDTDISSNTKTIEYGKYGILTPELDSGHFNAVDPLTYEEELLSNAIYKLLTDQELNFKYVQKSYERIRDFSPDVISTKWKGLIDSLV